MLDFMPEQHGSALAFSLSMRTVPAHRNSISPLRFLVHFGPAFSRACFYRSEVGQGGSGREQQTVNHYMSKYFLPG
ncbi:hypothetical protein BDQ94DRAFT_138491 [Aspergillus welwitschiae]|uniref:Uncharacterized protein n=1 Tax=Aspergillus welwitschiae TaxID=1341132 RepID=A0A3F3QAJ1_9EURO|nr:hypothetical protein BDQ94DRAFT_138491 [Aspergillus welwitschiae]RDH36077.1 hypothetical protein BDQ94DRAFT_138491 [Aspergillus welwitschiae]